MLQDSTEILYVVGGPRVSVVHALEFIVTAVCQFQQHGPVAAWKQYGTIWFFLLLLLNVCALLPPSSRGILSVSLFFSYLFVLVQVRVPDGLGVRAPAGRRQQRWWQRHWWWEF